MKNALLILLLCIPSIVTAEVYIDIHGLSRHIATDKQYNERNYGAGISVIGRNGIGAAVGGYRNSLGSPSVYAGLIGRYRVTQAATVGLDVGVVSGYGRRLSPMIVPVLSIGIADRVSVNWRYLPALGDITPAVASVSVGIRLD